MHTPYRNTDNLLKIWTNESTSASSINKLKMAIFNVRSLSSKTLILSDFISSTNLDFMFLTESWLKSNGHSQLVELCLPTNPGSVVVVVVKRVFTGRASNFIR